MCVRLCEREREQKLKQTKQTKLTSTKPKTATKTMSEKVEDHSPAAECGAESGDPELVASEGIGGGGGGGGKVKGPWSPEEDAVLSRLVSQFGARNWSLIARGIPGRSGKSCRLRWCNQLDPCLKRKPFTGKLYKNIILNSIC